MAIRLPRELARRLQVSEGSPLDLEVREGELIVRPSRQRRAASLEKLLKDCRPSQLHAETDFGPDVGREMLS